MLGFLIVGVCLQSTAFAAPRPPQPPWPEATLRTYSFDSSYWLAPWNEVALYEEQAGLNESWSGYSLVRDGFVTTPVVIPLEPDAKPPSFAVGTGAVRFWISPSWSTASKESGDSGPGRWARLLELVSVNSKSPEVKWSLHLNEAGDTIYLSGTGLAGAKQYLQAPVTFAAGDWRLITLCYSPTSTVLQIDGEIAATGAGLPPLAWWETNALGLVIGSDVLASPESLAGAEFEEVTTLPRWPRKSDWQELYYLSGKRRSLLGPVGTREEEQTKLALLKGAGLLPESYGEAGNFEEGDGPIAYSYAPESLWLELTGVSNNVAYLIVHGTVADVAYEILSKKSLTNSEWAGEQVVIGTQGQDWTPTMVAIGTRTNELFFWARTLVDTDGDGLPDWWELGHGLDPNNADTGGTGVSDGYKDGDNDGWTNLQEYQNGTSPSSFNTPAAPQGFSVSYRIATGLVEFNWQSVLGPVTGYSIRFEDPHNNNYQTFNLSPVSTSYTNYYSPTNLNVEYWPPQCWIQAHYPGGDSAWSPGVTLLEPTIIPHGTLVRGPQGGCYLVVSALPESTASLLLSRVNYGVPYGEPDRVAEFTIEVSNLINGTFLLPEGWTMPLTIVGSPYFDPLYDPYKNYGWHLQTVTATGSQSLDIPLGYNGWWDRGIPFFDGRAQLKQNLSFLLRAATPNESFGYYYDYEKPGKPTYFIGSPASYAYASFIVPENGWGTYDTHMLEFWPFDEHSRYRNFAFDPSRLSVGGQLDTGVFWEASYSAPTLPYPATNRFVYPTNLVTFPTLLGASDARWLYWHEFVPWSGWSWDEIGITQPGDLVMATGYRNLFGLSYLSAKLAWGATEGETATLTAGGSISFALGYIYPETEQPSFQNHGYYFAPVREFDLADVPLPGHTVFAPTNLTPLLVASVGDQNFTLAGYAKLAVTNGYPGVYGYLGQYFDKALKMTNGVVTTNETGILSPYGEFFPAEPGMTALVTLPDLDTNERGTATVYVVSMNLDANHDGTMDRTFAGPDTTTAQRAFVFWVNDDHDVPANSSYPERDLEGGEFDHADDIIRSARDLEDFARLWISGVPPISSLSGHSVTLHWRNFTGSPAIKLYSPWEADGGNLYLSDTNIANNLIGRTAYGEVAPGDSYTFGNLFFSDYGRRHFIFEGSGVGKGELVLTIYQGTNVLAETSLWLDLKNIKDMYEWASAENVTDDIPPSDWVSRLKTNYVTLHQPDETKQIIVFVHGINNTESQCQLSTATTLKRLYWSGYRGKVAGFRWPCGYFPPNGTLNPYQFNRSEFYAFKAATAFTNYLNFLATRPDLTDYTVSILAHSQGAAIVSEALNQGATFDNVILSQAAMPAHAYDGNVPTLQKLLNAETNKATPYFAIHGGYHECYTNISGNVVNLFNTNDYALVSGTIGPFDTNWEKNQETEKPESFFGAQSYYFQPPATSWRLNPGPDEIVYDMLEVRSMVARSRSRAVGAQGGLGGVIDISVDLSASFGFGGTREDHSGQFTRPIQTAKSYYDLVFDIVSQP